ncbi:MAG TPA: hypothetical protein PKN47_01825 [Nitrospira sp.]|nr:hypothetical protein [Nitrospira sp.]
MPAFPFLETVCQLRSEEWAVLWRVGQLLALGDQDLSANLVSTVDILETVKESRGLTAARSRRIKGVRLLKDGTLEILYRD